MTGRPKRAYQPVKRLICDNDGDEGEGSVGRASDGKTSGKMASDWEGNWGRGSRGGGRGGKGQGGMNRGRAGGREDAGGRDIPDERGGGGGEGSGGHSRALSRYETLNNIPVKHGNYQVFSQSYSSCASLRKSITYSSNVLVKFIKSDSFS